MFTLKQGYLQILAETAEKNYTKASKTRYLQKWLINQIICIQTAHTQKNDVNANKTGYLQNWLTGFFFYLQEYKFGT